MKKISKKLIAESFVFWCYILLFPGFFVYHFLVARAYIQPYLGGFFSVISLIIVVPLFLVHLLRIKNQNNFATQIFYWIIFWSILIAIVNYLFEKPSGWYDEMLNWSITGVLFNVVCFFVASNLDPVKYSKNILFGFLIMIVIVVLNIGDLGIFYVKQEAGDVAEYVATYQGFARSLVVTGLILSGVYWRKFTLFYLVVFLSLVGLFFNGARTEFVLFGASIVFLFLAFIVNKRRLFFNISFVVFLSILFWLFYDYFPESRMLHILDLGASTSNEARLQFMEYGSKIISSNVLGGGYGEYTKLGGVGYYPHNIISAWVNLGFVGFVLYLMLIISMWITALKSFRSNVANMDFLIFILFLVFVTMALIFSKEYSYMVVGFVVGLHYRFLSLKNSFVR